MGGGGTNQHFVYDIASDSWSPGAPITAGCRGRSRRRLRRQRVPHRRRQRLLRRATACSTRRASTTSPATPGQRGRRCRWAPSNPGATQTGEFVYVVGGWGLASPGDATSMPPSATTCRPTRGRPDRRSASPRPTSPWPSPSDALYAMGGDSSAPGFFDANTRVERLDLAAWPGGEWTDLADPLPAARTANQAGFCTTAVTGGEIWSVGGFENFIWHNDNWYRESGEGCGAADVPWLSEDPVAGTIDAGASVDVTVTLDASVPEVDQPGAYNALLADRRGHPAHRAAGAGDDERHPARQLGQGHRHGDRARRVRRGRLAPRGGSRRDRRLRRRDRRGRPVRMVARGGHLPDHGQRRRLRHPDRRRSSSPPARSPPSTSTSGSTRRVSR